MLLLQILKMSILGRLPSFEACLPLSEETSELDFACYPGILDSPEAFQNPTQPCSPKARRNWLGRVVDLHVCLLLVRESEETVVDVILNDVPERQAVDRGVVCDIVPLAVFLLTDFFLC